MQDIQIESIILAVKKKKNKEYLKTTEGKIYSSYMVMRKCSKIRYIEETVAS